MEFIPLEEIAQEEIPLAENEVNKMIEHEHLSYLVEQILMNPNDSRTRHRIAQITKAFYGIGYDEKTLKELEEEHGWNAHQIYGAKRKGDRILQSHKELFYGLK